MKRNHLFGAIALIIAGTGFVFVMRADDLISWYLSRQYKVSVRVSGARPQGWKGLSVRDFSVGPARGGDPWLEAGPTQAQHYGPWGSGFVLVRAADLKPGNYFRTRLNGLMTWVSKEGQFLQADLDGVFFITSPGQQRHFLRILELRSEDFTARGGVLFEQERVTKMNVRWSVSASLCSIWPGTILKKMVSDNNGWHSAGLVYGGNTWTLRGVRGPIFQLSGDIL